jgi:hypothetical protein
LFILLRSIAANATDSLLFRLNPALKGRAIISSPLRGVTFIGAKYSKQYGIWRLAYFKLFKTVNSELGTFFLL